MRTEILSGNVKVVCAGLRSFVECLKAQKVAAVGMDFRPPAGGDSALLAKIEALRAWKR